MREPAGWVLVHGTGDDTCYHHAVSSFDAGPMFLSDSGPTDAEVFRSLYAHLHPGHRCPWYDQIVEMTDDQLTAALAKHGDRIVPLFPE